MPERDKPISRRQRQSAAWTNEERSYLVDMASAGIELTEAARRLFRRQTDITSEAVKLGCGIEKGGPTKRWALILKRAQAE